MQSMRRKTQNLSQVKKDTWNWFSRRVRLEESNKKGIGICITCGRKYHWKKAQAGHFIPGRHNGILFDRRGVHFQCSGCNIWNYGKTLEYLDYMLKNYGQEVIDELRRKDKEIKQFTMEELLKIKEENKKIVEKLLR